MSFDYHIIEDYRKPKAKSARIGVCECIHNNYVILQSIKMMLRKQTE